MSNQRFKIDIINAFESYASTKIKASGKVHSFRSVLSGLLLSFLCALLLYLIMRFVDWSNLSVGLWVFFLWIVFILVSLIIFSVRYIPARVVIGPQRLILRWSAFPVSEHKRPLPVALLRIALFLDYSVFDNRIKELVIEWPEIERIDSEINSMMIVTKDGLRYNIPLGYHDIRVRPYILKFWERFSNRRKLR